MKWIDWENFITSEEPTSTVLLAMMIILFAIVFGAVSLLSIMSPWMFALLALAVVGWVFRRLYGVLFFVRRDDYKK